MDRTDLVTRLRATAFFSLVGAGIAAAGVVAIALVAILAGDTVSFGELIEPLLLGGAIGATGGFLFATVVQAIGAGEDREGLPYSRAVLAGALATFLAPLVVGLLFFASDAVIPLSSIVSEYITSAWGLLGLGGAIGAGLNRVAKTKELPLPDERDSLGSPDVGLIGNG